MVVNDYAGNLTPRGVLGFIASRLAPTGGVTNQKCVHINVTISAIYVCTFSFRARKSYILPFRPPASTFPTKPVEK